MWTRHARIDTIPQPIPLCVLVDGTVGREAWVSIDICLGRVPIIDGDTKPIGCLINGGTYMRPRWVIEHVLRVCVSCAVLRRAAPTQDTRGLRLCGHGQTRNEKHGVWPLWQLCLQYQKGSNYILIYSRRGLYRRHIINTYRTKLF